MDRNGLDHQKPASRDIPPEEFIEQVKESLDHLYDIEYLEKHPLTFSGAGETEVVIAGQRLRWEISNAIESLNPGAEVPFAAPPARVYNLLSMRYLECRTVQQAAQELNLSARQAHRHLRQGEESVAAILWSRRAAHVPKPDMSEISSLEAEIARLRLSPRPADVCDLLRRAVEAVAPLAEQREARLRVETPAAPLTLFLDPAIAEQVVLNLLSHALEQAYPGDFHLTLSAGDNCATLTLRYMPETESAGVSRLDLAVEQLADRLGWTVQQEDRSNGSRVVTLQIAVRGPTVLVVDDNEGLIELLERYLADQTCRVVGAANGREGLRLAESLRPDAILLDMMMPEMHGWEFLQRLRAKPGLGDTPVIICSVIHNPRLAYCLGASLFIPKPVSRNDILNALRQVGVL